MPAVGHFSTAKGNSLRIEFFAGDLNSTIERSSVGTSQSTSGRNNLYAK